MTQEISFGWILQLVKKELSAEAYEQFKSELQDSIPVVWEQTSTALNISTSDLAKKLAEEFSFELAELPKSLPDISDLPHDLLEKYSVVPIKEDDTHIFIASASPFDQEIFSMLSFLTDKHIEFRIATPDKITEWISTHFPGNKIQKIKPTLNSSTIDDSAIVRLVRKMLEKALSDRATDIHLEPYNDEAMVRFRIDGILKKIITIPWPVYERVVRRIKVVSQMDTTNSHTPQDGQVHLDTNQGALNLRVSSVPVNGGEKFVVRILNTYNVKSIDDQNFLTREAQILKNLMLQKNGVLIISGPTGSGKTTTLNSAISEINSIDKCIVTIEDPVEYKIEGIAQININDAQGLTFESALRHTLRQDPDVILVGEVRDSETAQTAIRSALTGHLVLTTLHTIDAITIIPRLKDLGITSPLLADSLKGLAGQRLVRKLCTHCAETINSTETEIEKKFETTFGKPPEKRAHGCFKCNETGYKGRIPLLEIITIDKVIADAIRNEEPTTKLTALAKEQGMLTMGEAAVEHILNGSTSVEEAFRVLGNDLFST